MDMIEYYDSLGWKPFREYMCDVIYMEYDAQLVIRTKDLGEPPHYKDVFLVTLNWEQGHGNNWYFETEDGLIFKPDEVKEFLFDYS
ncbi:hypothetical protein [Aeromonas phage AS-yj]|uniref:Uncharacterized protein n=4 Tax=Ceceduovirus TaxID=2842588 RepID=A0A411B8K6_9CAUD|nr:hypothetical protein HWB28_gp065 [Aeromonas phage AS-zj]YP_009834996.1 hypothetical protein HWB29_gp294 [Aeromonas phage AS-sw]ATI18001.1 hypothetical protein [Aeromonas phage AS-yj]QAX97949.1 hypothetical protein ASswx1_307 [Aeromonas phage Asswx_1]ASU00487.1 hypothetical protein [Aeromonas phage AS-zj]ATI18344.1 hypothetical protein [Aeromonas phage AS-sw]